MQYSRQVSATPSAKNLGRQEAPCVFRALVGEIARKGRYCAAIWYGNIRRLAAYCRVDPACGRGSAWLERRAAAVALRRLTPAMRSRLAARAFFLEGGRRLRNCAGLWYSMYRHVKTTGFVDSYRAADNGGDADDDCTILAGSHIAIGPGSAFGDRGQAPAWISLSAIHGLRRGDRVFVVVEAPPLAGCSRPTWSREPSRIGLSNLHEMRAPSNACLEVPVGQFGSCALGR